VVLGEFPEEPRQVAAREGAPAGKVGELGLALTSGPDGGVVVQGVDPQSEAAAKGVRPGDVIVKVNGRTVSNPGELETRIEESGKSSVLLLLRNESGQHFVALSLKDA
jgi:serine protease Do